MKLENVILTTDNCRYCLMCRHVCPVEKVTALETLNPHGWGLVVASQRRGLLEWTAETAEVIYSCADCGTCRAHCVNDQPLPEAIAAARAEIAALGLAPAAAYEVKTALERWGNPYQETTPRPVEGQGEVALFVGDDGLYADPGLLEAVLKVLKAAGIEPVLIGVGRNNGYLASSLGFPELAGQLAQANLADVAASGARTVLVLAPGDVFAFKQLYAERLGIAWPEEVELVEVVSLLASRLAEGRLMFRPVNGQVPFAYADPAHSVRVEAARYDTVRRLVTAVMGHPGVELYWRRERTHPAGSTALRFTRPHIANHLTYARLAEVREAGASLVITEDPGTLAAFRLHARRFGVEVQGLYTLLAANLAEDVSRG